MTAVRLQHVSIPVTQEQLPSCVQFYSDVIGMRQIDNLAARAWFSFGEKDHIHLLLGEGLADSWAHFALQVDDLDGTLGRLRAAGHEPDEQPQLWGHPRWWVRDPAGNLIELFEVAPFD